MLEKHLQSLLLTLCALCPLWLVSSARADLSVLNTSHYRIHTDLESKLAEDLGRRMEAMYAEYSQRLAAFNPPKDAERFEVYLFNRRSDYSRFTSDRSPNTGGLFMPHRNLLAAFLEGQGRDGLRRTLQHEAFHQFAFTAIGPNLPVWLNEGIAQVFEEGIWTGRGFMIGQVPPRRIRQLQNDMSNRRFKPFRSFLAVTDDDWIKGLSDGNTAAAQYDQAWAMTHFLIFAPDETGKPKYRARLIEMLKLIHNNTKATDAFVQAFSDNIDGFQQRFVEYTRTLQSTREANFAEYQSVLGDMLVLLASDGQRFDDVEAFRKFITDGGYRLRYTKGDSQWSTNNDSNVYFRDAAGQSMTHEQFYFSPRGGAPLPDMICRPIDGLQYRTIFHDGADRVDHETIIEGISR
jgi:hypothetical protein